MPATPRWLPVENAFEKQLLERPVSEGRSFVKGLRYNLPPSRALATATLTDCEGVAPLLVIVPAGVENTSSCVQDRGGSPDGRAPLWHTRGDPVPALPQRGRLRTAAIEAELESR